VSSRVRSVALAALLACAACDDAASPYFGATRRVSADPATFYVNNGSEPEYLDPGKCADNACASLLTQLFEGLTRSHPDDGHPVQGVAERWDKSDDNRSYRFHLRPGARWSDGRPVTAFDFDYAWKRALAPKTASRAGGNLAILANAEEYRLGKLRVVRETCPFRAEPREDARPAFDLPGSRELRRGGPVVVVDHVPGWTRVAPRSRPFGAAETWRWGYLKPPPRDVKGWVPDALLDAPDEGLVGVRAVDDLTLEVELARPAPYFLDLTSSHAFLPVRRDVIEAFAARGEEDLWTRPGSMVSNGPYTLDTWAFQYEITMKENPVYWDREHLKIRRIVWFEVQDYHAGLNLYKAGELDWLGDSVPPPAEALPMLATKKDFVRNDALSVYWFELNTKKPPLDDARVRRALDRAIDKQAIVERVTRGGQAPATHYVPDFTGSGYDVEAAADRARGVDPFAEGSFDPVEARASLSRAGYAPVREGDAWRAPGFPKLELLYNNGEGHRQIAVAVQAMWKENLGITVSLRSLEWKVLLEAQREGDFQIVRTGQTAEYDHPATFLDTFLPDSPQNRTGWEDASFVEKMDQASRAADPRESIHLYREAERIATHATPRIPLYFYTRSTLVKPWVKGFRGNKRKPHEIQFLWIDPSFQAHAGAPDLPAFVPPELPPPGPWAAP
jgi:oligopeptide transport system substrate-binding protein